EPTVIETHQADVTGDGRNETIELKGVLLSEETEYYHKIWADITSVDNKEWKISYQGGYEPALKVFDATQDKTSDIFYQSAMKSGGRLHHYQLDTLVNEEHEHIPLPNQTYISGKFTDN